MERDFLNVFANLGFFFEAQLLHDCETDCSWGCCGGFCRRILEKKAIDDDSVS